MGNRQPGSEEPAADSRTRAGDWDDDPAGPRKFNLSFVYTGVGE